MFQVWTSIHSRIFHLILGGISPGEAVERAKNEVARVGGVWTPPAHVAGGWTTYRISTNILVIDANLWIFVRRRDGEIIDIGLPTRRGWHRLGRCDECGYDLTGNVSNRCPECGAECQPGKTKRY